VLLLDRSKKFVERQRKKHLPQAHVPERKRHLTHSAPASCGSPTGEIFRSAKFDFSAAVSERAGDETIALECALLLLRQLHHTLLHQPMGQSGKATRSAQLNTIFDRIERS
jgi:hypothetical protein